MCQRKKRWLCLREHSNTNQAHTDTLVKNCVSSTPQDQHRQSAHRDTLHSTVQGTLGPTSTLSHCLRTESSVFVCVCVHCVFVCICDSERVFKRKHLTLQADKGACLCSTAPSHSLYPSPISQRDADLVEQSKRSCLNSPPHLETQSFAGVKCRVACPVTCFWCSIPLTGTHYTDPEFLQCFAPEISLLCSSAGRPVNTAWVAQDTLTFPCPIRFHIGADILVCSLTNSY